MKIYKEREFLGGVQKLYKFSNGYGASVVRHEFSYGSQDGLWELAVVEWPDADIYELTFATEIADGVLGDLTEEEVEELLVRIQSLEIK